MDVDKERAFGMVEQDQMDVSDIFRSIFTSCDVENTDAVQVSQLIEFIKPYLLEDLKALEDLRLSLDPEGTNALVSSSKFYETMRHWSQKVATASSSEDTDFDKSPSLLTVIDDKELPYTHSTPRTSLGDKLLKCKDLLNLSNVSGYSLSTSRLEHPVEADKTVLEEEIKKLEHQLSKTLNELLLTKQQLTASEDQNDQLQQDLDRVNRRLHAEQQVNEHLQKDIKFSEDLRDEVSICKKNIEELKKKLSQSEKDSLYQSEFISELEEEKIKFEKKIAILSKQNQDCLKELFDVRTECEAKEDQVTEMTKVYNELKLKFCEQKDFIDQLKEENDLLSHKKSTLEKALKAKSSNSSHSNLGNLILDLSKTPSPPFKPNTYNPPPHNKSQSSIPLLRRVLSKNSSTPITNEKSLSDSAPPESTKSVTILSPIERDSSDAGELQQGSSEEDFYWKLQEGCDNIPEGSRSNDKRESLHAEMHRADPMKLNETYPTFVFERDERIAELEVEVERLENYIKNLEDDQNESVTKHSEQQTIAQLEQNGVIVKHEQEYSQNKIDDMLSKIRALEASLRIETDNAASLEKKLSELEEKLSRVESLKNNCEENLKKTEAYPKGSTHCKTSRCIRPSTDGELFGHAIAHKWCLANLSRGGTQKAMGDLGEMTTSKLSLQEKVETLQTENQRTAQQLVVVRDQLKKALIGSNTLQEVSLRNKQLEEELGNLKQSENDRVAEMTRYQEDKLKLEKELTEFKTNLEKKLVAEFEGKVKYSMEAEEKILHLTQKCNIQEEDIKNLLEKCKCKNRALTDAENRIALMTAQTKLLEKEIACLNVSKTELEVKVAQLDAEHNHMLEKLDKMDNIDVMASEIQKHIKIKNCVIDELKSLNRTLEMNLSACQLDLKKKIGDILELRNELTKGLDIKNELWKKVKSFETDLHENMSKFKQLFESHQNLEDSNEHLKIEYNTLLVVYDMEVTKNGKLVNRVAKCTEEKDEYSKKCSELKIELDKALSRISEENEKNQELESKIHKLEEVKQQSPATNDSTSQTMANNVLEIEEVISKIKTESDQILEELETKLNEEVEKNRCLTNDLLEIKDNYTKNNVELHELQQKLAYNEAAMAQKLQESCEQINTILKELSEAKEMINTKETERSKIEKELNETKEIYSQQLGYMDNTIQEVTQMYNVLVDELNLAKEIINQKTIELNKTDEKLQQVLKELKDRDHQIQQNANAYENLIEELNHSKTSMSKIEKELKETKEHNRELSHNNETVQKCMEVLSESKEALKQEIERNSILSQQLKQFEEHIKVLKEELTKTKLDLNAKQIELGSLYNQNKVVKEALDIIQQENNQHISELKLKLDETLNEKQKLAKNLSEANIETIRLKEWLTAQQEANTTLTDENKGLKKENVKLQQEKEEFTNEIALSKQEKESLNKELVLLKQSLCEKEKNTEINQRLQEELTKNKALFENFGVLKKERDKLSFELKEIQALLGCCTSCNIKQNELQELQNKYSLLEIQLTEAKSNLEVITVERDALKSKLSTLRTTSPRTTSSGIDNDRDSNKSKTYSRQQITIEKLRDRIEILESQLKEEKNKNQQLNTLIMSSGQGTAGLENIGRQIAEKEKSLQALILRNEEISQQVESVERRLQVAKCELEEIELKKQTPSGSSEIGRQIAEKEEALQALILRNEEIGRQVESVERRLQVAKDELEDVERKKQMPTRSSEIGVQANDECTERCEGKTVSRFTIASRSESPDSPSWDLETFGLNQVKHVASSLSSSCQSVLEVPSLDVVGFADDIIEELELSDSSPRKKLDRDELEQKVTALTLRLVANANSISERIEKQTEKYRCQYEAILTLVGDISYRLRDHVCIGTAEPIVPVYVLLEEIKQHLRGLVQNASQVGVLICEDRMKRCWNLVVNYLALLRQDNEALHNVSRDTTPTQTGAIRRRNISTQQKPGVTEEVTHRRSRFGCCSKLSAFLIFAIALAMAVSLLINLNCRLSTSENQDCPLDSIARRVKIGFPPM